MNPPLTVTAHRRTPGMLLGPFYPLDPPAEAGSALWLGAGLPDEARPLRLTGRVVDLAGQPVPKAFVELWHADPAGRYRHPSAPEATQVLDGFAGYGRVHTDPDGAFAFTSLVPGSYVEGGQRRAPHLHVQVTGRMDRLVTQLFLPGHDGNALDRWFRALRRPELLIPQVLDAGSSEPALHLHWTAVLTLG